MPEGDTVWRTATHLDRALSGQLVVATEFRVPQYATVDLSGESCREVVSRGKYVLMRIGRHTVVSHLRMEGSWHLYRRPRPRWRRPAHTARAVIDTAEWEAVGFDLGTVRIVLTEREDDVVGHLGPDLLAPDFQAAEAVRRLAARPEVPVFVALLDQRNLAGLGNEYVNEVLFLARIAPTRPLGALAAPNLESLVDLAREQLHAHAAGIVRDFTGRGNARGDTATWVYGRAGRPCRRCGTTIRSGRLGDDPTRERQVFWCPRCQPAD